MLQKFGTFVALGAAATLSAVGPAMAVQIESVAVPEPSPISILLVGAGVAIYLARPKKKD